MEDDKKENGHHNSEQAPRKTWGARSRDSSDEDFDMAYPSARASQVRSSFRKKDKGYDDSYIGPDHRESSEVDDSLRGDMVNEDAVYPKNLAFSMRQRHNGQSNDLHASVQSMDWDERSGINFLDDPPEQTTLGRQIAKKLQHRKWYNPRAGMEHKKNEDEESNEPIGSRIPSLDKAWAYFEHVVLTRYVVEDHNTNVEGWGFFRKFAYSFKNFDEDFERAQPGENHRHTKLYDPITTPHMQLGDFGLGFGLYFSTLRAIGYILFLGGLLSVFNLYFFASGEYALSGSLDNPLLYGSAICTNTSWEICIDCNCQEFDQGWARTRRCAVVDNNLTLIQKNNCLQQDGVMRTMGIINYATVLFLLFSILALELYLKKQTIQFDEDEQTAQDYSIVISNPPPKANDPEVWREYFEKNFPGVKCAAVTCAVNNDLLIRALVSRREVLRMMELQLDPGTAMDIDNLALLAAKEARKKKGVINRIIRLVMPGLPDLLSRLVALNTSIKGLAQLGYPCTNVYVTFEREVDQRRVLWNLSVGPWHIRRNNSSVLKDKKFLFQGQMLSVRESVEPNSVRWQDLNATVSERTDQMILTFVITLGSILLVAYLVYMADVLHPLGAAFCIAGFNLAYPEFAKLVVYLEAHPTESQVQMSLYWKIAVFRWVNTAIVITVITPFTHTLALSEGLIPQIFSIFFAEIVTTNVIQITDVWGHFLRHVVAPRASNQDTMNLCFVGLEVELAERYTNMTKIMFLAFWYSSIFPGGLFLAAIALAVNYYTDRFSLMRTWKRAPHVSTEISTYSRRYFFSSACVLLGVMSSFYWSAFPFDNICVADGVSVNDPKLEEIANNTIQGTHNITVSNRFNTDVRSENITIEADDLVYKFCPQDFIFRENGPDFPFIYQEGDGEWMDEEQQWLSIFFGWTSVAVMSLIAFRLVFSLSGWVLSQFTNTYHEPGDEQGIAFHDVRNITGYIPQVRSRTFSYPLIACKCDKIGAQLFDWTDPERDYTYYDLTKDADHILSGTNRRARHSFSRVKHYPPNRLDDMKKRKRSLERRIRMSRNVFNSVAAINDIAGSRHSSSRTGSSSILKTLQEKGE